MDTHRYTNELIHESSPYLLQHAHNPVNWLPWGEKTFEKARTEKKLLIISIGYAACHWCHVMEHESFEDTAVARIMNENFVCIKVDREERPDVDQIYMTAVQLMTQRGGWPLNAVVLPDGRPFWGGTYFQKEMWMDALTQITNYYKQNPEKVAEYAEHLSQGIRESNLLPVSKVNQKLEPENLKEAVTRWKSYFDFEEGGSKGAPKFMMPTNLQFLLRWAHQKKDKETLTFVETSLDKMAMGGIYDQVGGGFARYSTDSTWKVPHFEKMLYDNGQLLSVYSQAFQKTKKSLYREIVEQTIDWLKREMKSEENGFYSSLDADSEGEEGKFYVWKKQELQQLIGSDFELFADYFQVNELGYWEDGNYILLRKQSDEAFAQKHQIKLEDLQNEVASWQKTLLEARTKRIRPRLDDKILTSWNALAISGLVDAFKAFGNAEYLELAEKNSLFLRVKQIDADGRVRHSYKNGESKINGFLEDYAMVIQADISLFEATGKPEYLNEAELLTQKTLEQFFDDKRNIFYFTPASQTDLINRSIEVHDNVIAASNSVMANNLFKLGHLLGKTKYFEISESMLSKLVGDFRIHPSGYSNWMQLMLNFTDNYFEVAIAGQDAEEKLHAMQKNYLPNCLFCSDTKPSEIELLQNRFVKGKTLIYICQNQTCMLPEENTETALNFVK
ncbi:MAG: thioredoxin domain-containing protein [Prolixibacteraceae bacterium]|jgi:hypothetical protein